MSSITIAKTAITRQSGANIAIDFDFGSFNLSGAIEVYLSVRFYYLGSSRPSVDRALSALGCLLFPRRRNIRLSSAGKKVSPAIMQVVIPTDITAPRL